MPNRAVVKKLCQEIALSTNISNGFIYFINSIEISNGLFIHIGDPSKTSGRMVSISDSKYDLGYFINHKVAREIYKFWRKFQKTRNKYKPEYPSYQIFRKLFSEGAVETPKSTIHLDGGSVVKITDLFE